MMAFEKFEPSFFEFLEELKANNNRDWFGEYKTDYESKVLEPCFEFIRAMAPKLDTISGHYVAKASKTGGSMMRVYRDTRFSKDKTPYKTNVGMWFKHEDSKKFATPGFYVHLEPKEVFLGVGIWRPDSKPLKKIRDAIANQSDQWVGVRDNKDFRSYFEMTGESLKRPPKGYAKDHPLIEDLKLKNFTAMCQLSPEQALKSDFLDYVATAFEASSPFLRFLCDALEIPY